MSQKSIEIIKHLFSKQPVNDLKTIREFMPNRARRSIMRDLEYIGYFSSYNNAGRYYTLKAIPEFNCLGLWFYQEACFSNMANLNLLY